MVRIWVEQPCQGRSRQHIATGCRSPSSEGEVQAKYPQSHLDTMEDLPSCTRVQPELELALAEVHLDVAKADHDIAEAQRDLEMAEANSERDQDKVHVTQQVMESSGAAAVEFTITPVRRSE
ncbi:hypothetical protein NXS19_008462 [Fusarium pseudograminearum]|nr:hypothetical protein NXS19_008462 [Fusarium pseudograminearum]